MLDQTPVQIAWVTDDLAATETALTSLLGARTWVRMPGVHFGPDTCTYRGRPADHVADISLSYAGDTQLEVISPVSGQSIYREFLDRCGPGLHHVCRAFDAAGFDDAVARADIVMAGTMPGGMRFAYASAADAGVPFIEFAHVPTEIQALFDHIKQEQQK
ncbi:VOC family protein [Mycobacterium sp. ITM-2016-00317]|uniref:VOC family protein n=1 Tax=Mycobacterium sp. ITM-2016-00317 TaxID=2099694 RepID=UPI000D3F77CC|nr:VOC family protein [Mycobacterium sp. ITM-2016-00317]WNG90155.1 VOC family protein [Mycobacterium sp. ITM-2016-00317]